jgi:hypothetical protein
VRLILFSSSCDSILTRRQSHSDHSYIQASHGLTTSFKYVGKGQSLHLLPPPFLRLTVSLSGYFSGKAHTFTATIGTGPAPSSPLFTIEGVWTGTSHFIKPSKHSEGKVFTEAGGERTPISCTEPIDAQGEFESRRVWKDVAAGIRRGESRSYVGDVVELGGN